MAFYPLVSIIMPVYNNDAYIYDAIESVLKQSYSNWELIIVDDGSTDQTSQIVDNYSHKYSKKIKAFHQKNSGVSAARNFALSKVSGEFVTFIDGDDLFHPERLAIALYLFKQYPDSDIVFTRHTKFTGMPPKFSNIEANTISPTIINKSIIETIVSDSSNHFSWNCMLKTSIAKLNQFPPIRFAEDYCFLRESLLHCKQVVVSNSKLYFYRRDNSNSMTQHFFDFKYIKDYKQLPIITYDFCKKNNLTGCFYTTMIAHEYAQAIMRIRKCASFSYFIQIMNDPFFRKGLTSFKNTNCSLFEKMLLVLVKHKFYLPFLFWVWH